ncbi:MAG: response regulator [Clostridium sp.]
MRILIVDDEKNIRISIERCLKSEGYDLEVACNGEEAVNFIRQNKYDLILLDIQMPKKSGIEVLKEIRKQGIITKVIMMTAFGTVDIAVDIMKLGAVDFICKPFTVRQIKGIVKDTLNKEINILRIDKDIEEYIDEAKLAIKDRMFDRARILLKESLVIDTSNPAIQNLLGVVEEKCNHTQLAQKYYRAALSLDATYKPADNNLKRTAMFNTNSTLTDLG